MVDFLFFLALLFRCGLFPMGESDCRRPPPANPQVQAQVVEQAP